MAGLPTGSVTFLFSDVQGSTDLLQRLGQDAFASVLQECRRTLRTAAGAHGGHEIDARGDEFFAAFASARGALLAAHAAQQAIRAHPWPAGATVRVRMGVHTGEPLTAGDAYVGLDVHRAARICGVAYGGQILLSQTTFNLAVGHLPGDFEFRELGEHRLKDLQSPLRLYQLTHPDLVQGFPPPRSLGIRPNNLPVQLTSFVGRDRERRDLADLLRRSRAVTLVGVGGSGKTRLALQVAADTPDAFRDGTWLVELASVTHPALVPQAASAELRVREESGRTITDTLVDELHGKQILLLLDNCEHLIEACAGLVDRILRSCPMVTILSTSREPLRVTGEMIYEVPPLSIPNPDDSEAIDRAREFEAVRLFVDRAVQSSPSFAVTRENLPAVVKICTMLDGIPLALELAAAKVRVLSVEQIVSRLSQRFRLLQADRRPARPRHQTLQAALDWSHDLLTDTERILLRRLSVFSGGFMLDAAEAVGAAEPIAPSDVLDLLAGLVEKSMVVARTQSGQERYRMLETVRQYASERLAASTEGDALCARHCAWFLHLAERAEPSLRSADQDAWLDRLETEHDNLRAALEWSKRPGQEETHLHLAGLLWWFWYGHGHFAEGRQWLEAAAGAAGVADPVRARALLASGHLAIFHGDYQRALAHATQALALYRGLEDSWGVGGSLVILAIVATLSGDTEQAAQLSAEALTLFREQKDPWAAAYAVGFLGLAALNAGALDQARAHFDESYAVFRTLGDRVALAFAISHLGMLARVEGRYEDASRLLQESLVTFEGVGDKWGIAYVLGLLGILADARADHDGAERIFQRSLGIRRTIGDQRGIAQCLTGLARVAHARGQHADARALLLEALALRHRLVDPRGVFICLTDLARVAVAAGDDASGARILGAAQAVDGLVPRSVAAAAEALLLQVRERLDVHRFDAAWNAGRRMSVESLIEHVRAAGSGRP